jgi:hypothetical protein
MTAASMRRCVMGLARRAVEHGVPPAWFGYRVISRSDLDDDIAVPPGVTRTTVQPAGVASNPLPRNLTDREWLPRDPGWWAYSMYDVPRRPSGPTYVATIPDATVTAIRDERGNFVPALLSADDRSLELREIRWRPDHATARRNLPVRRVDEATWILERSYHNHSHWLTAHLPKLLVLRDEGRLDNLLLPEEPSAVMTDSLARLGIDPADHLSFDEACNLRVGRLTVVGNDRFRPELLRRVREAFTPVDARPHRRVYVSRANAGRRKLVNESEIEAMLTSIGFESVVLEELDFQAQVQLMAETSVLCGPHGAGLTNMIFCHEGTAVIEFADLGFPNPNFYAMASALGHPYWLIPAVGVGDDAPLERDMHVDHRLVEQIVRQVDAALSRS